MDPKEKSLYHQIHPAKLLTDWGSTVPALYLLWQHNLVLGLLVAVVPSILASAVILRFVNLEPCKESEFGRYVRRYMTRRMEAARFCGFALTMLGAWAQLEWLIVSGLGVILLAWLRGILFPKRVG